MVGEIQSRLLGNPFFGGKMDREVIEELAELVDRHVMVFKAAGLEEVNEVEDFF